MACNENIDIGSGQPLSTDKATKNQESQPEQMSLLKKSRRLPVPSSLPIGNQSSEESNTTSEEDADSESSEADNVDGDASRDETSMDLLSPYNDIKNQREMSYANLESACENQNQTTNSSIATTTETQKGVVTTNKKPTKPRRRVATVAQRRAANIRERRRMFNLNAAFDRLRKKVPSFAYEKRLSRIETLKLAIMYIRFMDDLVNDDAYVEKYKQLTANANSSSSTSGFLSSASYLSLYGASHRSRDDGESCSPVQPLALGFNHPHQQQHQNYMNIGRSCSSIQDKTAVTRRSSNKTLLHTIEQVRPKREDRNRSDRSNCGGTFATSYLQQLQEPCGTTNQIQHCGPGTLHSSSPGSSTSVACCSSPASSSTMTTCHSTSTIFAESPDSSPLVIANSSPVVVMNGQQQDLSKPIYHYPHLRPLHDSYSAYDPQQLQPQPRHEAISDYYSGSGTCSQQNKLLCYDSNLDSRKQSGGAVAAAITNSSTNGTDYSQQSSNVNEHSNFNPHNEHMQTEHNQHHLDHRYQGHTHEDVVSHHQETHYSLHSIEAR